jgi:predicted dehydrogenase
MPAKLKWGVLGVANIATEKVIPAMQRGARTDVVAIASRDGEKARAAAARLGIPKAYDSYEALLADPDIDAVYNPLPNHLHVPWSIRAAEAGKHVLCEKPIGMDTAEARELLAARDRTGVKMQEAFMVRTHPQWLKAMEIARSGELGRLQSYMGYFSYFNDDAGNIRNVERFGGGALMDVGCYLSTTSRMMFGEPPRRVCALIARDPSQGVDTVTSMMLDYPSGQAIGTCGTRVVPYQRVHLFGSRRHLEIEIPFNAPNNRRCRFVVDEGHDVADAGFDGFSVRTTDLYSIDTVDQYQIQGDRFSQAVQENTEVPYPLEESVVNMRVIDALFRSAESGRWETP